MDSSFDGSFHVGDVVPGHPGASQGPVPVRIPRSHWTRAVQSAESPKSPDWSG